MSRAFFTGLRCPQAHAHNEPDLLAFDTRQTRLARERPSPGLGQRGRSRQGAGLVVQDFEVVVLVPLHCPALLNRAE